MAAVNDIKEEGSHGEETDMNLVDVKRAWQLDDFIQHFMNPSQSSKDVAESESTGLVNYDIWEEFVDVRNLLIKL